MKRRFHWLKYRHDLDFVLRHGRTPCELHSLNGVHQECPSGTDEIADLDGTLSQVKRLFIHAHHIMEPFVRVQRADIGRSIRPHQPPVNFLAPDLWVPHKRRQQFKIAKLFLQCLQKRRDLIFLQLCRGGSGFPWAQLFMVD